MKNLFYIVLFLKLIINLGYCDKLKNDSPHEDADLKPDPSVVYGKLDNGFRYVLKPNANNFSMQLYVAAGSLMEEEHEQGLAHFLEHMAFKGIRGYPEDQMIQTLQHLGVGFGSHNNAYTSFDKTVYKLDFGNNNTPEHLRHGLRIMAGIADGMILDETLINKEIGVILAEKHDRHDTSFKFACDFLNFVYNGSLINERIPIGLESVIKSANSALLRNFYKKWYRPERMILVIVGDLNQNEVETQIKENFATFSGLLEAGQEPNLGSLKQKQGLKARVYKDKDLHKTELYLISQKPYQKKIFDKMTKKRNDYLLLARAIFDERIQKLTKQKDCPIISGSCSTEEAFRHFEEIWMTIQSKPKQVLEAIRVAENELRRIFEYGFTNEEFEHAKKKLLTYQIMANMNIGDSLLQSTINEEIFNPYSNFINEANKEECLEIFKNAWDLENLLIYLSTNSDIQYTDKQLKEAYYNSKEIILEAPSEEEQKEEQNLKYSYDGLGEKGTIIDECYNSDLECYQYRLSNNVRVNLKQTNYDKDVIHYQINFGNGKDEPETKPAIISIADEMLENGGIGQFSREELLNMFEDGVNVPEIEIENNSFSIAGSINPIDFEAQMNLICGCLMEYTFPSDLLSQTLESIFDSFSERNNQTLEAILKLEVEPYLTQGHPDFEMGHVEDFLSITPQEIKDWMEDALTESYIEISIVGDFDKEQVLEALLKTIGALPDRKNYKQCYKAKQKVMLRKGRINEVFSYYPTSIETNRADSRVYWELPDEDLTNDNFFTINRAQANILSSILDERLRQKVRMELGEAYTPSAFIGFNGKAIVAQVLTDPQKADLLCEIIVQIGETLGLEGVTEDEFNRASQFWQQWRTVNRNLQICIGLAVWHSHKRSLTKQKIVILWPIIIRKLN